MKDNFLTIPDAPNYEINSDCVVRNKKTGKILKHTFINGNPCVIILTNEKKTSRGVIFYSRLASQLSHLIVSVQKHVTKN